MLENRPLLRDVLKSLVEIALVSLSVFLLAWTAVALAN